MNNQAHVSTARRGESVIQTNKVLRNTYMLLGLTLAFSAFTAFLSASMNLPHPGLIITLVGFYGLLFLVHKTSDSAWGLLSTFALTGFMGYTLGPILGMISAIGPQGAEIIMTALGGTALIFFSLSAYVLTTKKDMSFLGGMMVAGFFVIIALFIANLFLNMPILGLALSGLFILFSAGAILMQTSAIVRGGERNYVLATVTLYVSIYNIFVSLLNILMAFGGDE
ncbi:Bax inhibitor-1/YccA family protein [Pseudidiomarina terrestris]|uniref:Bax inhibitor-1/YccA family protein n=1 Tax=Pseudidiomarina terrestris TaxID=2820060 RepID=A0AAW7QXD8_9GAMM|nr:MULTISPECIES: Bax inhibitor-1/YccA family protein [unclassified Pseudidiomarina]MDN7123729.1 Bax inhibitor-1/YccA family protein [Pseudidiomarina sp. 1APP75-32.1]MDN7126457.1 Bax inhibitor-1/YccA family protein [Pseudidiomarina sp. 1APR75-33.1]MDN7128547.1 Bax inhibitor-1/YccA family protein [Pseudidiomarina sp. 1APR75-15]MDN7135195.1 Bax inhibitor-1/YccA family protein [Pseudidiomarina sp. 1ASP75-5]MDN7137867.1 Bax inhibitor-1/YccA family protein [Pseudidiomarina sp. 1ASP75-14]